MSAEYRDDESGTSQRQKTYALDVEMGLHRKNVKEIVNPVTYLNNKTRVMNSKLWNFIPESKHSVYKMVLGMLNYSYDSLVECAFGERRINDPQERSYYENYDELDQMIGDHNDE